MVLGRDRNPDPGLQRLREDRIWPGNPIAGGIIDRSEPRNWDKGPGDYLWVSHEARASRMEHSLLTVGNLRTVDVNGNSYPVVAGTSARGAGKNFQGRLDRGCLRPSGCPSCPIQWVMCAPANRAQDVRAVD